MIEYYLNNQEPSCCEKQDFLKKENFLGEFESLIEKQQARENLGIDLQDIDDKISRAVIDAGQVQLEDEPQSGHTQAVVSSGGLFDYLTNLKNGIEDSINNKIIEINSRITYNCISQIVILQNKISELEEEIDEIRRSGTGGEGGTNISNNFGNSTVVGISQKKLTDSINEIWDRFSDITGEEYRGINLIVTPDYFAGDTCDVHITASAEGTGGNFEKLQIYINGNLKDTVEDVEQFEWNFNISNTSVLMCKATILGIEYTKSKTITRYESFWIGAGTTYSDVMKISNIKRLSNNLKGNFNINFNNGDHLIVITGSSQDFYRVDMNGIEIPVEESTITVNGNTYKVYTSVNTFQEGTFNIDVNS